MSREEMTDSFKKYEERELATLLLAGGTVWRGEFNYPRGGAWCFRLRDGVKSSGYWTRAECVREALRELGVREALRELGVKL